MARDSFANNAPNRSQFARRRRAVWRGFSCATFFAGTFPTAVYRDLRHFALELFSKRDPAEPRVHVVVYSQEDQHSEDRLLANAWSKDYIRVEREGSNRRLVRLESANDANGKVAKAKWPKSAALLNDLHPEAGSAQYAGGPPTHDQSGASQ